MKDEVEAAKAQIISGELLPFTGPLYDNTGALRWDEGEAMPDEALLSFNWLLHGVTGVVPE